MKTMEATTKHLYVVRDPAILEGEPIIKGTRTPMLGVTFKWYIDEIKEVVKWLGERSKLSK